MRKINDFLEFGHNHKWSSELATTRGGQVLDKIFSSDTERKIGIQIDKVSKEGYVELCEIYIYNSVADATRMINKYEYETGINVKVFEITKKGYLHLFYKPFDGMNYSRLAQPEFTEYSLSNARYLYDTEAVIYIATRNDDTNDAIRGELF